MPPERKVEFAIELLPGTTPIFKRAYRISGPELVELKEQIDELWVIARREDRLQELRKELGAKVRPVALDLLKKESFRTLKQMLDKEKPQIHILVNASGFGKYGTYADLTEEEINNMIDLNCKSVVHMSYLCLHYMKRGDRIITMGSSSAFQPLPYFNMYASSKVFVMHFCRALNVELKNRGITVTCVCPGYVRTEFFQVAQDTKNPTTCTNFNPMYEPEDVVEKALKDSRKGKDMSVLGGHVQRLRFLSKLLPAGLVMKTWLKIK